MQNIDFQLSGSEKNINQDNHNSLSVKFQFQEIRKEGLEIDYSVSVPNSIISSEVDAKLAEIAKTVKIEGFRPGKVPLKILEKKFRPSIFTEVINTSITKAIDEIIGHRNFKLAAKPIVDELKFDVEESMNFVLKLETFPKCELIDFSKITIEKLEAEPAESDILEAVEDMLEHHKEWTKAEEKHKSQLQDKLIIDYEGFIENIPFDGGKAENSELILGSGKFIPGFEDQLIGKKSGSNIDVKVKFPDDYGASSVAGKNAVFKVSIKEILSPRKLEMNDKSAQIAGFESLADLRESALAFLNTKYQEFSYSYCKTKLFNALENMLHFDIPKSFIDKELELINKTFSQNRNIDEDIKDKTDEEVQKLALKIAQRRIRIGFALSEYAEANNIKVTPTDLEREIYHSLSHLPGHLKNEMIATISKDKDLRYNINGKILENKAVEKILAEVNLVVKKCDSKTLIDAVENLSDKT
ncbi:MAG: trigger factor [Rickettsiaceae bacterium]|nr:trigger factor [Rickettsiaceae bacterium]